MTAGKIILVTNDDGIDAEGLKQLALAMNELGRVIIVAPTIQRSGESKSLTLTNKTNILEQRNGYKTEKKGYPFDAAVQPHQNALQF